MRVEQPVAVATIFTWVGLVCGISFLEAWLKFKAPGVTLPIGLGIGRIVFHALNKAEWICAIIVVGSALWRPHRLLTFKNVWLLIILTILLAQTFWLLPKLDERAELVIRGLPMPPSKLHLGFIAAEAVKVISLIVLGIFHFNRPALRYQ